MTKEEIKNIIPVTNIELFDIKILEVEAALEGLSNHECFYYMPDIGRDSVRHVLFKDTAIEGIKLTWDMNAFKFPKNKNIDIIRKTK